MYDVCLIGIYFILLLNYLGKLRHFRF